MEAMVYTGPLTLEILDVAEPQATHGEVLISVEAVGICGSELEGFASQSPFRVPPLIMGHEFVGRRVDTGQRVSVNPLVSCGTCALCLRGRRNLCRTRAIIGIHRPGAFAELVCVPENNCYPLPESITADQAAVIEPLANAAHAFRLAQQLDPWPLRVGIIGGGAVGTALGLIAGHRGVADLAIADLSGHRRRTLKQLNIGEVVSELAGEFDVVFDAVGTADTRRTSVERLRPGGVAIWVGLHGPRDDMDGLDLIRNEKTVMGTFCYHDQDYRAAIDLAGRLTTGWITSYPLKEGVEVFQRLVDGDTSSTKILLLP